MEKIIKSPEDVSRTEIKMSRNPNCQKCGIELSDHSVSQGNSYCYDCYTR